MAQAKTKDILSLIEQEHRKVEQLFKKAENAEEFDLYDCFNQIYKTLNLHTRAEEQVLYPAMEKYEEIRKYVDEALKEHEEAKAILEEIKELKPSDTEFKPKINEVKKSFQHHVKEEESEIFSAIRKCMNEKQLIDLGKQFQQAKVRLEVDVETAMMT